MKASMPAAAMNSSTVSFFYTLREAQLLIEKWRRHHNTVMPHSVLGYRPQAPETIVPIDPRPTMH